MKNKDHSSDLRPRSSDLGLPFFSILVPVYNHEMYIGTALDSILAQTDEDWEAVVVNDGSTDSTPEIIEQYSKRDSRIRTVHKENGGQPTALNAGLENALGEWICWLSSDDMFDPDKLAVHREWIERNPDCRFFYTKLRILDEASGDIRDACWGDIPVSPEYCVLEQLESNHIPGISICVHREVFKKAGHFDNRYRYAQDYDFYLRAFSHFSPVLITRKTCTERQHNAQYTVRDRNTVTFECARVAIGFLNCHEMKSFVSSSTVELDAVLDRSLDTAMNLNAAMYGLGFHPILISRILEWVLNQPTKGIRKRLQHQLGVRARAAVAGAWRADVAIAWRAAAILADCGSKGFVHELTDPISIAQQSLFRQREQSPEWIDDIARYIDDRLGGIGVGSSAKKRVLTACCPNRRDAFSEMLRQAQHDKSLGNSVIPKLSFRAKSRNLNLGNIPLTASRDQEPRMENGPVPSDDLSVPQTALIFGSKGLGTTETNGCEPVSAFFAENCVLMIMDGPQKLFVNECGLVVGMRRRWRRLLCLACMPSVDILVAPNGTLELRLPLANRHISLSDERNMISDIDSSSSGETRFPCRRFIRWVMCQIARLLRILDRLTSVWYRS